MQFLYPGFLWALAFLAIPIIIHLFYFRRFKRVYFTNVRFLKEVQEETSARRRLRNLLVLSMRLLALTMLVLAFAQPFISRKGEKIKRGPRAVSIYLDNSFSMQAESSDAALLELGRKRARQIMEAYGEEDRFQLLTNDLNERQHYLLEKEEALNLLEEITYSPVTRSLSQILELQRSVLHKADDFQKESYLISDFQRSVTDFSEVSDSTVEVYLVPMQAVAVANVSIDSAWFENPVRAMGQTYRLFAKVSNYGEDEQEDLRLSLTHEGETKPAGTLDVPAGKQEIDTINVSMLQAGWHEDKLEVADYPVQFDDHYYFAFELSKELPVLNIYGERPHPSLRRAFTAMPQIRYEEKPAGQLDYSAFSNYKLIVLDELPKLSSGLITELRQYVSGGGNILVFPHAQADVESYRSLSAALHAARPGNWEEVERQVSRVNTDEFVFRDVFERTDEQLRLPVTQGNYILNISSGEVLLRYRDGSAFLAKSEWGEGHVYFCAAPLDEQYSNLVRNAEIFVPMLFRMVLASGSVSPIAYVIGKDEWLEVPHQADAGGGDIVYKMSGPGGEFIPGQQLIGPRLRLNLHGQIREAGFYHLYLKPDRILATFAFNYDRRESDLRTFLPSELAEKYRGMQVLEASAKTDFSQLIAEQNRGLSLWRWCLILALVFLGLEGAILRWF